MDATQVQVESEQPHQRKRIGLRLTFPPYQSFRGIMIHPIKQSVWLRPCCKDRGTPKRKLSTWEELGWPADQSQPKPWILRAVQLSGSTAAWNQCTVNVRNSCQHSTILLLWDKIWCLWIQRTVALNSDLESRKLCCWKPWKGGKEYPSFQGMEPLGLYDSEEACVGASRCGESRCGRKQGSGGCSQPHLYMWPRKHIWRVFIKGMKKERAGGRVGGRGGKGRKEGDIEKRHIKTYKKKHIWKSSEKHEKIW